MSETHGFDDYAIHPAAEIFPLMEKAELDQLAADIKEHGLKNFIVLLDGKIIDGRNRYLACKRAGVAPFFEDYRATSSPEDWVVSQNLHRRHLSESQRAIIGAALVPKFKVEAKERQRQGGREKVPANLPEAGEAREKAARLMNCSARSIQHGITVRTKGSEELVGLVMKGELSVSVAAKSVLASKPAPASSARRRTWPRPTRRKWSVPWAIGDLAATIRKLRTPDDLQELVRLLTEER